MDGTCDTDVAIIGTGLGGLTSAILLGKLGLQMFSLLGVREQLKLRRLGAEGILKRCVFNDFTFDLPGVTMSSMRAVGEVAGRGRLQEMLTHPIASSLS